MATRNLTRSSIERIARPTIGRSEISDVEKGLFLHVRSTGVKTWVAVYRIAGIGDGGRRGPRIKHAIGNFPEIGVEDARAEARRIIGMAAAGRDPKSEFQAERVRQAQNSVAKISNGWLKAMADGQITGARKRPVAQNTYRNREMILRRQIIPLIGSLPMDHITPAILGRMLQGIEDNGGPVDETLRVINGLWFFAEGRGLASGIRPSAGFRPRQSKKVYARSLSNDELRSIWGAARRLGYPFGSAVQLLMLTGQRRSEIASAQWDWYDTDRGTLTIPASATKNRAGDHEVVLSQQAIEIMGQTFAMHQQLHPKSPYIFTSRAGDTPISGWSKSLPILERIRKIEIAGLNEVEIAALEAKGVSLELPVKAKRAAQAKLGIFSLPKWRLHDLRHTFITRARDGDQNEGGEVIWSAALDVVQATVNHSMSEGVTGLYDHGDIARRYRLKRRELAEWWSVKLAGIVG